MTQTRRTLLRGSGGMLAAGTVLAASSCTPTLAPAAVTSPDAELLNICAEYIACDRQFRAIYDGPDDVDDDEAAVAAAPIVARIDDLLGRMEQLRATTAGGVAARAQSLEQHNREWDFSFDDRDSHAGRLLDYLLRDAAALGRT